MLQKNHLPQVLAQPLVVQVALAQVALVLQVALVVLRSAHLHLAHVRVHSPHAVALVSVHRVIHLVHLVSQVAVHRLVLAVSQVAVHRLAHVVHHLVLVVALAALVLRAVHQVVFQVVLLAAQ